MDLQGSHTFTARFDGGVVRDAVRAFVVQRTVFERRTIWGAAGLMLVASLVLLLQGNRTLALLAVIVVFFPLLSTLIVWQAHSSSTLSRYRRMGEKGAEITIDAEGFSITSDLGPGRLTWPNVTEIWERPRAFMLFSGAAAFNILPKDTMPAEVQAYLASKAIRR